MPLRAQTTFESNLPHQLFRWQRTAVYHAGVEVGQYVLSGHRQEQQRGADRSLSESGGRS